MPRLLLLLLILTGTGLGAAENSVSPEEVRDDFTYGRAFVTGTVEGVTEFLPVSSTGHMIISDRLLGVPKDEDVLVTGVADRKGRPVSQARVADDYIVIVQIGAIAAVLIAYFGRISGTVVGMARRDRRAWRLAGNLLLAFLPAAVCGLLFKDVIAAKLFRVEVVAGALIVGGILILVAERRLPACVTSEDEVAELGPRQAMIVGVCQCVALVPGTSRSLATILGGRLGGLSSTAATEFSFLVGFVTLSAASLYKMYSLGPALAKVYPVGPAGFGLLLAAVTAFLAVKWLVDFVSRRGLAPFAWYRIALGAVILAWVYAG